MNPPVVCTIGATEPWNAAGLGLDSLALAACGVRAVSVVAGVTAQDGGGVSALLPMPAEMIVAQLAALRAAPIAAYRIGALLDVAAVDCIAALALRARAGEIPVVYDPVLGPSAGGTFADEAVTRAIAERLIPSVTLVTPNLSEAARLGSRGSVSGVEQMADAGRALVASGARAALVKGGHLAADPCDVLVEAERCSVFEAPRLPGSLRGTGCLLACAIAADLARGFALRDAVVAARAFVRARFADSFVIGGMRVGF